jgi:hypothetical protein
MLSRTRIGVGGGETIILNSRELCKVITLPQNAKDQTIWMTPAQSGFPLERDEDEVTNNKDTQMGRTTTRYLHPVISTFVDNWETDLTSSGKQPSSLSPVSWNLDPPSLTTNHPPRITDSNTRITLQEGSLKEPLPKSDNDLGWVQIQQKSLRWEEHIQGGSPHV